jgi:hypothetical protein
VIFSSAQGISLGHLDGLELGLNENAPVASDLLRRHSETEVLILRLHRSLKALWLTEYAWETVEVFVPIYELIREMMAFHGLVFARHEAEWRIVLCEEEGATESIRSALDAWMDKPDGCSKA